jgi:hypothetical protein
MTNERGAMPNGTMPDDDARDAGAHPPFERLSELADGALPGAERDAVERHLAGCAACRADADALRGVLALAGAVPRAVEPPPEVWAGVRARLAPRPRAVRVRQLLWRRAPALAAAAVLLAVVSVGILASRASVGAVPDAAFRALRDSRVYAMVRRTRENVQRDVACATRIYCPRVDERVLRERALARATAELKAAVDTAASLPPEARASLARSLGVVDTAVAEARAALIRTPSDPAAVDALSAVQERRLELLRQAARLLSED